MNKKPAVIALCVAGCFLLGAVTVETVDRLFVQSRVVSSWSDVFRMYSERRELPPLPDFDPLAVYKQIQSGDFSFMTNNWFRMESGEVLYVAEDSKELNNLKLPLTLRVYDYLPMGETYILSSRDGEKFKSEAAFDSEMLTEEGFESLSVSEQQSDLLFSLTRKRCVWEITLKPESEAWNDLLAKAALRSDERIAAPLDGGMMMSMSMPPEHTNDIYILRGRQVSGGVLVPVYCPSGVTNVELYSTVSLFSNWTVTAENLVLDAGTNVINWLCTSDENSLFFRAGNKSFDTDRDLLCDARELWVTGTQTNNADSDNDALSDGEEVLTFGLDPNDADSDQDSLPDGWEVNCQLDALSDDRLNDPDDDGLNNLEEYQAGTQPRSSDSDLDGMPDGWEMQYNFNPNGSPGDTEMAQDPDQDGLKNAEECLWGTDPYNPDCDTDGFMDACDYRPLSTDYPVLGEGIFNPVSVISTHATGSNLQSIAVAWQEPFWYPEPRLVQIAAGSAFASQITINVDGWIWKTWGEWQYDEDDFIHPYMEDVVLNEYLGWAVEPIKSGFHEMIESNLGYEVYIDKTEITTNGITNAFCFVISNECQYSAPQLLSETDGPRARRPDRIYAYSAGDSGRSETFRFVFNRPVTNCTVKWLTYEFNVYENERYGYDVHSCLVNGTESEEFVLTSGSVAIPITELNGDFNRDDIIDTADEILRSEANAALTVAVSPEMSNTPSNAVAFTLGFPFQYDKPPSDLTLSLAGIDPGERFRVWSANTSPGGGVGTLVIGGGDEPELIIDPPILFDTATGTSHWWPISDPYEYAEFPKTLYIECLACGPTNDGLAELRVASEYNGEELASARLPVSILSVEFLDASKNPTTTLKVGKWENAFNAGPTVKDNFIDLDPDRFHVRVNDQSKKGSGKVSIKLSTDSDGTAYDDDATEIELNEDPANSGIFISTSLLMVSDDVDDDFTNPNVITDDTKNDRTHKVALDGTVKVQYPETGTVICEKETSVPKAGAVHLTPIIFRDKAQSSGGTPVISVSQVANFLQIARERYAQIGVELTWSTPAIHDPPTGVDLIDGLTVRPSMYSHLVDAEAKAAISNLGTAGDLTDIHIFYVNELKAGSSPLGGTAVADYWYDETEEDYIFNIFMTDSTSSPWAGYAIAHELGHLLTDAGHASDAWRLMHSPLSTSGTVGSRRFVTTEESTIQGESHVQ